MAEGRSAFPIAADSWYVEPAAATTFLLDRETFRGRVLDPACGQGNIVRTCIARGLDAKGTDLRRRVHRKPWFIEPRDFLDPAYPWRASNIITNPPYGRAKIAEAFIRRAWAMPEVRKLAVFVNAKFLFSSGRAAGIFAEMPPSRVWPVLPRPSCPPGQFLLDGGKAEGGVENFAWLIFSRDCSSRETQFLWSKPDGPPLR